MAVSVTGWVVVAVVGARQREGGRRGRNGEGVGRRGTGGVAVIPGISRNEAVTRRGKLNRLIFEVTQGVESRGVPVTPVLVLLKSLSGVPLSVTVTVPVGQGMVEIGGMFPASELAEQGVPDALVTSMRTM